MASLTMAINRRATAVAPGVLLFCGLAFGLDDVRDGVAFNELFAATGGGS